MKAKIFEGVSDDKLQEELDRRQAEKVEQEKPKPLPNIDISKLQKRCCEYIDEVATGDYLDEDYRYYIFEAAVSAVFGKDVWNFVNSKL